MIHGIAIDLYLTYVKYNRTIINYFINFLRTLTIKILNHEVFRRYKVQECSSLQLPIYRSWWKSGGNLETDHLLKELNVNFKQNLNNFNTLLTAPISKVHTFPVNPGPSVLYLQITTSSENS